MATYIPAVLRDQKFQQAATGDKIAASQIPVSGNSGNTAEIRPDGVFVGSKLPADTYYVNSAGTDVPTSGSKTSPFKTLEYALTQIKILAGNLTGYSVNIALYSGQSFELTQRYTLTGNFTFTFYGDSTYGDFDDPQQPVLGELSSTLVRPAINIHSIASSIPVLLAGFDTNYSIEFRGITVNLPGNPPGVNNPDYGTYDVVLGKHAETILTGAIINKSSVSSYAGIVGIRARSRNTLTEYASQFLIVNERVQNSSSPGLAARPHFIHFYMDQRVNSYPFLFPDSVNSNSGYGLLTLVWSDTQAQSVGSIAVQATFPTLPDVNFGLRNYITNISRDQQSRPLNIISSRLI